MRFLTIVCSPQGTLALRFGKRPPASRKRFARGSTREIILGKNYKFPKKLVAQLASAVPVPVSASYKEPEPTPAAAPEPVAQPELKPVAAEPTPEPAPQPAPVASIAPPAEPAQGEPAPALPHTASNIPLIGLIGFASLGLAGVLSFSAKRT